VPLPGSGGIAQVSGNAVAQDALQYDGAPYIYGGAKPNGWDCSGFVNWVLGHDLNIKLPGATKPGFNGNIHGPVVLTYANWSKAERVSKPEPGDLCIWVGVGPAGHIGIAVSPTKMISALNPSKGTLQTPIVGMGPPGAPLIFKRVGAPGQLSNGCVPFIWIIANLLQKWSS